MIDDPKIEELRREIDRIDHELLRLIEARLRIVLQVGDRKREESIPVYDPVREERLIRGLAGEAQAPLDQAAAERIFRQVVAECRRIESEHVSDPTSFETAADPDAANPGAAVNSGAAGDVQSR